MTTANYYFPLQQNDLKSRLEFILSKKPIGKTAEIATLLLSQINEGKMLPDDMKDVHIIVQGIELEMGLEGFTPSVFEDSECLIKGILGEYRPFEFVFSNIQQMTT